MPQRYGWQRRKQPRLVDLGVALPVSITRVTVPVAEAREAVVIYFDEFGPLNL